VTYADRSCAGTGRGGSRASTGGDLVVTTLAAHEQREVTGGYGHVQAGFRPQALRDWLTEAGLVVDAAR